MGWASTCNSTGQTLGYTVSFVIFMAMNNAQFSDKVRQHLLGVAPCHLHPASSLPRHSLMISSRVLRATC